MKYCDPRWNLKTWFLFSALFLPCFAQETEKGLNKRFLDPEMDVAHYAEIFASENRDVFVNRQAITAAIGLKAGDVVADIGAGTGIFLPLFTRVIGKSGHYFAVDIAPKFVQHLRTRADENGFSNVTAVLNSFESVTLPAQSIDVAFVCDTYHHFDKPAPTLASIFSALRPGGRLVLVDFERIPGKTAQWLLDHVRAGKNVFRAEIEAAGFRFQKEVVIAGFTENYYLYFERP